MDVVSVPQSTEFLLPSSIPAVETDFPSVGCEIQGVHFHPDGCCICNVINVSCYILIMLRCIRKYRKKRINPITNNHRTTCVSLLTRTRPHYTPRTFILLLKLSSQVALHKCRFPCTSISYEHEFEGWHTIRSRLSRKSLRPSTQPFLLHHNFNLDTIISIYNPASYPAPPIQRRPTHHRDRPQSLQTNPSRSSSPLRPYANASK